jgi:hypothetical protein
MNLKYFGIVISIPVISLALVGCGQKPAEPVTSKPSPKVSVTNKPVPQATSLPEWAPANPSPEFLRAAKILRPLPLQDDPDIKTSDGSRASGELMAKVVRYAFPRSYEFFGTLSDKQMELFLQKGELRIPFKSLTAGQRNAFDKWQKGVVEAFGNKLAATTSKLGAKKDYSNVDVGFGIKSIKDRTIGVCLWIKLPGQGGKGPVIHSNFAKLPNFTKEGIVGRDVE